MVRIVCAGKSDIGRKRHNNEDALVIRADLGLVSVADGMGGAASGELASGIFVRSVSQVFEESTGQREKATAQLVQRAFLLANETIWKEALENPDLKGMGCTAELLTFEDRSYLLGHVGDSRTYLFRNGKLRRVTKDHSLIQDQLDKGFITPEEARTHTLRNVITRAVGVHETLAVDLIRGKGLPGDLFLLCSDGLSDMLTEEKIAEILSLPVSLDEKSERLVESANVAGGSDNITVALCLIEQIAEETTL
jgi:serine/threonine protein phosphatase PrpC